MLHFVINFIAARNSKESS